MKPNVFSSKTNQEIATAPKPSPDADFKQVETAFAPLPEAVGRRDQSIDEKQDSLTENALKHEQEAEANLIGGIELESQMHSGSSIFLTEL